MQVVVRVDTDQMGVKRGVVDFCKWDAVWNYRLAEQRVQVMQESRACLSLMRLSLGLFCSILNGAIAELKEATGRYFVSNIEERSMPVSFSQKLIHTATFVAIAIALPGQQTAAQQPAAQQPAGETPQHSPQGITKQNPPPAAPAQTSGVAATLSDGTVVQNRVTPPRLQFTEAQRVQIRAAVGERSSEVDFPLTTADAAKSFQPAIGVGVPAAMEGQALPMALTDQIPALKDYIYLKLPAQAVIVDPMSRKVAEIVSLP